MHTTPAAPAPTRKPRRSVYAFKIEGEIPLDMTDAQTLVTAIERFKDATALSAWPEGTKVTSSADIKKVAAE